MRDEGEGGFGEIFGFLNCGSRETSVFEIENRRKRVLGRKGKGLIWGIVIFKLIKMFYRYLDLFILEFRREGWVLNIEMRFICISKL